MSPEQIREEGRAAIAEIDARIAAREKLDQQARAAMWRRDRLLFVAAVFALIGAVAAAIVWNLARAWGS